MKSSQAKRRVSRRSNLSRIHAHVAGRLVLERRKRRSHAICIRRHAARRISPGLPANLHRDTSWPQLLVQHEFQQRRDLGNQSELPRLPHRKRPGAADALALRRWIGGWICEVSAMLVATTILRCAVGARPHSQTGAPFNSRAVARRPFLFVRASRESRANMRLRARYRVPCSSM